MTKLYTPLTCIALAGALMFASACDGLSDLNEDPNTAPDVPENVILPSLLTSFSYEVVGNDPARITTHWVKQLAYTGVVTDGPDAYDVREDDVDNLWEFFAYTDVMQNARILADEATADSAYGYVGIAKVVNAFSLSIMTDLFGSIPLSDAFDPENTTPAYDSQEAVYTEIFRLLDEAIADLERDPGAAALEPGSDDLLYGGDLSRWQQLAYTLKARFAMRLSNAPGHTATEQAQMALDALENGFQSNADDADMPYSSQTGAENPWYQLAIDGKWDTRDQLAAYYVELLDSLGDPRLPVQARPVGAVGNLGVNEDFETDDPQYRGHVSGTDGVGASQYSSIGEFYSAPDASLTWISYAEARFIAAEATYLTLGAEAAQPIYEEAIQASMEKLDVPQAEITAYIEALPALTDGSVNPVEEIITQKYIANFLNLEAYNDFRRTGYPDVLPVEDGEVPIVPLRFPYPESEFTRNAEERAKTGVPRGFDALLVPVWWDTTLPPEATPVE